MYTNYDCPSGCYKLNDDQTCPLKNDDGEEVSKCPHDLKCIETWQFENTYYCNSYCPSGCDEKNPGSTSHDTCGGKVKENLFQCRKEETCIEDGFACDGDEGQDLADAIREKKKCPLNSDEWETTCKD